MSTMRFFDQALEFTPLAGAFPVWQAQVRPKAIVNFCTSAQVAGGRLISLWGSDDRDRPDGGFTVHVALGLREGLALLHLNVPAEKPVCPDLSAVYPAANRLQRALFDLLGVRAGGEDQRPWLRQAGWPMDFFPLRHGVDGQRQFVPEAEDYPFVRVEGDGVHEIPVGPIHAGIIEPGHFRFSIVGERVLRLEERLGYVHKGIEKRFMGMAAHEGHKLAGRVSGDSTVAYAWAYCMAAESAAGVTVPPRALLLRALWLERERVANHLGDSGYLGNDAALAFGLSQFLRLKEDWLRENGRLFGHRLLMDRIVPGGAALDVDAAGGDALARQCDAIEAEVRTLRKIYDGHAGLQDRFQTTGRLMPQLAHRLGVTGLAGRASGQAHDLRVKGEHHGSHAAHAPYDQLDVQRAGSRQGDVAARVALRFDEVFESLRLIRRLTARLKAEPDEIRVPYAAPSAGGSGVGWVEGWRGDVFIALESDDKGLIRRCHAADPSWRNWPALEHAIMGNIVPDFPLINKSFNLSYSGADL